MLMDCLAATCGAAERFGRGRDHTSTRRFTGGCETAVGTIISVRGRSLRRFNGNQVFDLGCRVAPGDGVLAGETAGLEVGHGYVDHCFAAGGQGLVVVGQAAMEYQPPVGPLHRPPPTASGSGRIPWSLRGAGGDLHVDAEGGGVLGGWWR